MSETIQPESTQGSSLAESANVCRAHDWESKLDDFVARSQRLKFAWGIHDCCLFACDAVLCMTGTDLAADFRGKYDSALGAGRCLTEYGGAVGFLADAIAQQFGIKEVPVLYAQRGDVVLLPSNNDGPALGIVSLDGWNCLGAGMEGLTRTPLNQCLKAWRI
jgi:hypothetical protein